MTQEQHSVIGSGIYNYDIIAEREYPEGFVIGQNCRHEDCIRFEDVGGTCGNVISLLAHFGWKSMPQAQFDKSKEGLELKKFLEGYGCDTRYVENIEKGGTTRLLCLHKLDKQTGDHVMKPRVTGETRFARRKQLRVKDEVEPFLAQLEADSNNPNVYFFDAAEAGPRAIAAALRKKGTLVYFEPESDKDKSKFCHGIEVSDIVKFSGERVTDLSFCNDYKDKLFIQTLGSEGLKFSLKGGEWTLVKPVPVENVVDWEGCGDTTTAAFLDFLSQHDALSFDSLTPELLKEGLEYASKKAALCTQYLGSKSWIGHEND